MASRGSLAGKSIPVLPARTASKRSCKHSPPIRHSRVLDQDSDAPSSQEGLIPEYSQLILFVPSFDDPGLHPALNIDSFFSPLLENPIFRFFFHHYDQTLVAYMAWADCTDNPWRTIMTPMAMESPSVLFSILAFAAKHVHKPIRQSVPESVTNKL